MESRAKLLGHPIHQMLIVFPLGLLATSVAFDVIWFATHRQGAALASFWMISAGIVTGLVAAIFGAIDWAAIPAGTRAKRIGAVHGLGNVVVVLLFAIAWWIRNGHYQEHRGVPRVALILGILAVLLALFTAWLGGELVNRLGVGVYDGAHLDAPSSLSGRPARDRDGEGRRG
jgi:uncharacterized membrane protein